MFKNKSHKIRAIKLRKQGFSYSEIIKEISIAKSTLSSWLKEIGLTKSQKQRLTIKKRFGQLRGAMARKNWRIATQQKIYNRVQADIGVLTQRELWLLGVALYWAEGAKEKENRPGSGVKFSNSDPRMIRLFLHWLLVCCNINRNKIYFEIYIHEIYRPQLVGVKKYWASITGFSEENFKNIYFKKHNIKTRRKNSGILYNGLLRVNVRASSELNRKITGWVMGICKV